MYVTIDSQLKEYAAEFDYSFSIELSKIYSLLGYSRKDVAKRALISNFIKDVDYIIKKVKVNRPNGSSIREDIFLTKDCFKSLCLISGKKQSKEIRKRFIELEKQANVIYLDKSISNKPAFQQTKDKLENIVNLDPKVVTERDIQNEIISLLSYTGRHIQQEFIVRNILNRETQTRRFDFVEFKDSGTTSRATIYEIKKAALTVEDISLTLGNKGYLALAEQHESFKDKKINFVFIADSITDEAQRLIKEMSRISFIKTTDFALILLSEIKEKAKAECPSQYKWFIENRILPYYPLTLPRKLAS